MIAALLGAAAAAVTPIAIHHERHAGAVALAGPDVMVLSEPSIGTDHSKLVAVPRTGGPARTLLDVPDTLLGPHLAASAQRVAVKVTIDDRDNEIRVYSGPPSGPLTIVRRAPERFDGKSFSPANIDVDGDRMLLVESADTISFGDEGVETPVRASILDSSGWTPIPWANGKRRPIAIAGPYAAVDASDPPRVEVVELATGTAVATIAGQNGEYSFGPLDLSPDGQLVIQTPSGIEVTGPGLMQRNLPNSGRLGGAWFAGNTFVAIDEAHKTLNLTAAAVARMRREHGAGLLVHAVMPNGTVSSYEPYESEFQVDL